MVSDNTHGGWSFLDRNQSWRREDHGRDGVLVLRWYYFQTAAYGCPVYDFADCVTGCRKRLLIKQYYYNKLK